MIFFSAMSYSEGSSFSLRTLMMPGPLSSAHEEYETQCEKCHQDFDEAAQVSLCRGCHDEVAEDITSQRGYHGRMAKKAEALNCNTCHSEHHGRDADILNFNKALFDHNFTDFSLQGRHRETLCTGCHNADQAYRTTPTDCADCHRADDIHQGNMGESCDNCHNPAKWTDSRFDHDETEFVLKGAHREMSCNGCHLNGQYAELPSQCNDCHSIDDTHRGTRGNQCQQCHTESNWDIPAFDHDTNTDFALRGSHKVLKCESCHKNTDNFYETLETRCVSCHRQDDTHFGANGGDCANCHNSQAWQDSTFDHSKDTDFHLTGRHSQTSCNSCHIGDTKPTTDCHSCHREDDIHNGAMKQNCGQCHTPRGWYEGIRFNHDLTVFPLVGMHTLTQCNACHSETRDSTLPRDCADCHQGDDAHNGNFNDQCSRCHNPNDWQRWLFDHNSQSDFTLSGKHLDVSCRSCHIQPLGARSIKQSDCYSCHKKDDVHRRRFGSDCGRCHWTESFRELRIKQP